MQNVNTPNCSDMKMAAKNNSEEDFKLAYYADIDDTLIEGLSQNQEFFLLLIDNEELKKQVLGSSPMRSTRH